MPREAGTPLPRLFCTEDTNSTMAVIRKGRAWYSWVGTAASQPNAPGKAAVFAVQHLLTLGVDDLTLGIHDIIIFQNVLSGAEMAGFHIFLGIFHRIGEDAGIDGLKRDRLPVQLSL